MKSFMLLCLVFILGASLIDAYTWCCTSPAEMKKCYGFSQRINSDGNKIFDFDCVLAEGTDECMKKIKDGSADLIDLDGGDIFAYRDEIDIVAAENVGYKGIRYYAVAVVKKGSNPELSMKNLAGYKTCHTGVGKTSGWLIPMGYLLQNNQDPSQISKSCAPGAAQSKYAGIIPGGPNEKWCELCVGDEQGEHKCDRDSDERYYGYHGAFNCMIEGAGDVAFIKHTIIPEEEAHKYELLCPDSPRRASPLDWETCNLGGSPSHAVVMKKGVSSEDASNVFNKIVTAWNQLGDRNTYGRGKNILWGSKVNYFVYMNRMSPRKYMGDYFCNVWALKNNGQKHSSCFNIMINH